MASFVKDPAEVLPYTIDWTDWLATGETISSHTITAATGLTVDTSTEDTGIITIWLSGGTDGTRYDVTCHIETDTGKVSERTIHIQVANR